MKAFSLGTASTKASACTSGAFICVLVVLVAPACYVVYNYSHADTTAYSSLIVSIDLCQQLRVSTSVL